MEAWPDFLDEIAGGDACVGDARILQATLLVTPDVASKVLQLAKMLPQPSKSQLLGLGQQIGHSRRRA